MFLAIRLAKIGYFSGDPSQVLQAPARIVLNIMQYETFDNDYQIEYAALNKAEGS